MAMKDFPIWRKPRHHMDVENASDHVHWVELFFDLIQVVTIFLLGNYLSHHLDWEGFLVFTGLFLAIFYAWADSSIYNSVYVSTDIPHRAIMAVQIVTAMFIAASLDSVTGGGWTFFALAYAANRALTAALYRRAHGVGDGSDELACVQSRNFFIIAAVFAVSAFLPRPLAYWVFGAGLLAIQLQYMLPGIGTLHFERFRPRFGHVAERFGLIMLILLGEGFFKLVVTLSEKGIYKAGPVPLVNMAMGGLGIFVMAWIYFDAVGNAKPRWRGVGSLLVYWFAHIVLMWATVMVGVALAGEIYAGFLAPYPADYGRIGTAGLAIFLAATWVLQTQVEGRDTTRRYQNGRVRLFGIAVSLLLMAVVAHVPGIVGNLLWGIALFSQVLWPLATALRDLRAAETA